jgi:8-oxo-dGTP diphosphatase
MNYEIKEVVTGFLSKAGNILIFKRSQKVGSYQGRWAGISGYVEKDKTEDEQILIEISEETGLCNNDFYLIKKGIPLDFQDSTLQVIWRVYPFLFEIKEPEKIKIDWEHTEYKWIKPNELKNFETVPSLSEALISVL